MADNIKFVQSQELKLAIGANTGATSIRIRLLKDTDGNVLDMDDFGTVGYGTLEPNTTREEQISWTGITDNSDDTYTLTGVKNVLTKAPYTESSGTTKTHVGGSKFIISNNPGLYNTFANKKNDETIEGVWTFDTTTSGQAPVVDDNTYVPTDDAELVHKKWVDDEKIDKDGTLAMAANLDLGSNKIVSLATPTVSTDGATKGYVDGVALAGAPDADESTKGVVEEATTAEVRAGTATGGTGAKLFVTPEKLLEAGGLTIKEVTAGATINGATLPVPVYQNDSDNEFYACDGNDTAAMKFLGFAVTNGTDGAAMDVQFAGIVPGFTGLTEGEKYYLSDTAGAISNSPGTYEVVVGVAISETELLIQKGKRYASGTTTFDATTTTTITTGFRPSRVRIYAACSSADGSATSSGGWTVAGGSDCAYWSIGATATASGSGCTQGVTTSAWYITLSGAVNHSGVVDTITDTTFRLNNTESTGSNTVAIFWEAEGEL